MQDLLSQYQESIDARRAALSEVAQLRQRKVKPGEDVVELENEAALFEKTAEWHKNVADSIYDQVRQVHADQIHADQAAIDACRNDLLQRQLRQATVAARLLAGTLVELDRSGDRFSSQLASGLRDVYGRAICNGADSIGKRFEKVFLESAQAPSASLQSELDGLPVAVDVDHAAKLQTDRALGV